MLMMMTTATMKDSVADSGDGHTESGPPRENKRCSMKMCQTEYRREKAEPGRVGSALLPAFQSPDIVLDAC
jgi:hypothetical protein